MEPQINLGSFFLVMLSVSFMMICSCEAYTFYVGGKDGWVLKPSENYNHWAERNRFQINDTIIFKYKKGSDSVLLVNKDDYYKCNKANPIEELNGDGESKFTFAHSGPFFFISGHDDNCEKGQKLIIIVLAIRNRTPVTPPATPVPTPAPWVSPPPAQAESPNAEAPGSENTSGVFAPAPAPAKAAAAAFGGSGDWVVAGLSSIGMSVVLGGLVGLF